MYKLAHPLIYIVGYRLFSLWSFFCSCFSSILLRTTSTSCLLSSSCLSHVFIIVYQFDETHFCVVTQTVTSLDDTSVTTRTVSNLNRDFLEQFCYSEFVLQVAKYNTTRVCSVIFRLSDQRLNELLQSLSLCYSRSDSFVLDQRTCHVSQHSVSVRSSTTKMIEFLIMSHFLFFI